MAKLAQCKCGVALEQYHVCYREDDSMCITMKCPRCSREYFGEIVPNDYARGKGVPR